MKFEDFKKKYFGKDLDFIIEELGFNKNIPSYVGKIFNNRDVLARDFQAVVDEYLKLNPINKVKK